MWSVTMAAMNPAAEIHKTDKKLLSPPPPPLTKSDFFFFFLYDKSNLNIFLLLTQLCGQGKKKKKNE